MTWFQDDCGAARAGAMEVHPVAAHVDQLPGHRIRPGVEVLPHSLVAATDGGQHQHSEHRVQQPPCAPAAQLSSDPG